jgi:hypothetical protein
LNKFMILVVMLALTLAVAVPAIAQIGSGVGQSPESGDVALKTSVANKGNYASQCTPATQFGNTGNFDNGSSFVQAGEKAKLDDFEPGGVAVSVEPTNKAECGSTIQQSSAASSGGK